MSEPGRGAILYDILRHVRPLLLNSARTVEATLRGDGLSVGMRAVLEVLAEHGASTVPDIAHRLELTRQAIQRHVNDLAAYGWVESRPNPAHRRSVLIGTTAAGAALFHRVRADELAHLGRMAPECSPDELAAALRVLAALDRDVRRRAAGLRGHDDPQARDAFPDIRPDGGPQ